MKNTRKCSGAECGQGGKDICAPENIGERQAPAQALEGVRSDGRDVVRFRSAEGTMDGLGRAGGILR